MKIVGLIPARGGSKGIPMKNIKDYCGYPLIYYSIQQSLESKYISETYVTTDSKEIQDISQKYGAQVPFLRPSNISGDFATDYEFITHFIYWYQFNYSEVPNIIVQLRPTYPNRSVTIIDDCIDKFIKSYEDYDSLRTVIPMEKSPYKMYTIESNILSPLFKKVNNILEPYNQPRQILPKTYMHNGYLDIIKTSSVIRMNSISGNKIYPYVLSVDDIDDIDTIDDWKRSEEKNKVI